LYEAMHDVDFPLYPWTQPFATRTAPPSKSLIHTVLKRNAPVQQWLLYFDRSLGQWGNKYTNALQNNTTKIAPAILERMKTAHEVFLFSSFLLLIRGSRTRHARAPNW
jgi:hypothetical protein